MQIVRTAISVPDALFHRAEAAAAKLGVSRSDLYARALTEYLERHHATGVTERLNAVYSRHSNRPPKPLERAQFEALDKDPW